MSWRDRATAVKPTTLPVKGNAYVDDLGTQPMNEASVLKTIDPNNWRNRSIPVTAEQTPAEVANLTPAQTLQNENPLLRTAGRLGRNVAAGVASIADIALLVPKTAALGAAALTGNETLKKIGMTPSMHDSTQGVIDQATGNTLKPTGFGEKAVDFGAELLTGTGVSQIPAKAGAAPGIMDAVRGVMNPGEVIANSMPKVPQGFKSSPKLTSDQLRAQASGKYQQAEKIGGALKPEFTNNFLDEIEKAKPQTVAGKLISGDSPFTKLVEKLTGTIDEKTGEVIGGIRNRPMTLDEAQEIDEYLSEAIDGFTELGKLTKQGKKLYDIQTTLRDMIEGADESLIDGGKEGFEAITSARSLWAKSRRLADVERIIQKAEQMEVPATGIKTGFRTLYNNPNRMRGFTAQEKEAIRKIAEGGPVGDLLKTFGSRLVTIGGAVKGGPVGAAMGYGAATASRGAANKMALSKAEKVADVIRGGSSKVTPQLSANQKALAAALANTTARAQ